MLQKTMRDALLWMDEIRSHHEMKPLENPLFIGIYRGVTNPGFLGWCKTDFVHPQYFSCPVLRWSFWSPKYCLMTSGSISNFFSAASEVPHYFLKKTSADYKPDDPQIAANLDSLTARFSRDGACWGCWRWGDGCSLVRICSGLFSGARNEEIPQIPDVQHDSKAVCF